MTEAELELFVDKLLYLAKGADVCVFAGSLPRGVDAESTARLIEELKRLGVTTVLDTEGEPMIVAHPRGPRRSSRPNELEAEELVGPRVRRRARTACARSAEIGRAGRARGDHDAAGRAASRCSATGRERAALPSARSSRSSRSRRSASGDAFLAGFVAGPLRGPPTTRTACASRSPAAPSRRSTSAPACSTRARSSGSLPEVRVERARAEPAQRSPRSGRHASVTLGAGANVGCSVRRRT